MAQLELLPIDVAKWRADDYFSTFPEGARDKKAYFAPEDCVLPFIKKNRRYLFKESDRRFPEQFWGEIVAHRIGVMIGVSVPPAYPATDSIRGRSAALIEWFYDDGESQFMLGGSFMQALIPGFDMKTGAQHNFETIILLCRALQRYKPLFNRTWLVAWAKGFIFDALIGNTDRHQNNWGILFHKSFLPVGIEFSPWFDNGTSLGCERWPKQVDLWTGDQYQQYLNKGRHHVRWDESTNERCGFFDMPKRLIGLNSALREPMLDCVKKIDLKELEVFLDECKSVPMLTPLSSWRAKFMLTLVGLRQERLLQVLT